jgi:hypothetical protein
MSQPSTAARTSLAYITLGSLLLVWTAVWYWYLRANPEGVRASTWYICYGLLASGAVLLFIGLAVGQIGRSARHAELPPPEVAHLEAKIDQATAAKPVVVVPAAPAGTIQPVAPVVAVPTPPAAVPANPPAAPAPRV